ncbi:hypothetical protein Q5530_35315 [Saccharothrix sp. BKS2]|uniref:hypothetical protein n=1 Tax=Saccharothrix sp. BKS2 TaxID=3064400 RepID=UPI0039EB1D28
MVAITGLCSGLVVLWWNRYEIAGSSWVFTALGACFSAVISIATLGEWATKKTDSPTSSAPQPAEARRKLAEVVLAQWRQEAAARQLDNPSPIAVSWHSTNQWFSDIAEHVFGDDRQDLSGRADRIEELADDFRRLKRRRLVVLGKPGSGKTTLAVLLLRRLLVDLRPGDAVPVLFSVGTWDPEVESLHEWLVRRLVGDYPMPRAAEFGGSAPEDLVAGCGVLPVLDGLDEISDEVCTKILDALNLDMTDADQVIVTCRTEEYVKAISAGAAGVVRSAAVVTPRPPASAYVVEYLRACTRAGRPGAGKWSEVFRVLADGRSPLARALRTPLDLWLLRVVYVDSNADPGRLADVAEFATPEAVRDHLIDNLVHALVSARRPGRHRPGGRPAALRARSDRDVLRWPAFLASRHNAMKTRDIAWWRFPYFLPRQPRRIVAGALGGLTGGVTAGISIANLVGVRAGLTIGLTVSLAAGLVAAFLITSSVEDGGYADLNWFSRSRVLVGRLALALLLGAAAGVCAGVLVGVPAPTALGGSPAVAIAIGAGGVVGLISGVHLDGPMHANLHLRGRLGSLLRNLTLGIALVVGCGLLVGVAMGSLASLVINAGRAAEVGIISTVVLASRYPAVLFLIASTFPAVDRKLPWRLMSFLEDAYRLGLLRRVGDVYQFRHAELQDRLAHTYDALRVRDSEESTVDRQPWPVHRAVVRALRDRGVRARHHRRRAVPRRGLALVVAGHRRAAPRRGGGGPVRRRAVRGADLGRAHGAVERPARVAPRGPRAAVPHHARLGGLRDGVPAVGGRLPGADLRGRVHARGAGRDAGREPGVEGVAARGVGGGCGDGDGVRVRFFAARGGCAGGVGRVVAGAPG